MKVASKHVFGCQGGEVGLGRLFGLGMVTKENFLTYSIQFVFL